ncbi:MAG TPA: sigma-E factor regulatory protein RseB domain-containing protein [Planctomycetota bacterium]|nr:sigma-E factor regulatory protein RseB domain-containing protein [Planctomycetota bacterium]
MEFGPPNRSHLRAACAFWALALGALAACQGNGAEAPIVENLATATSLAGPRPAHRGTRTVEVQEQGVRRVTVEQVFDDGLSDIGLRLLSVDGKPPAPRAELRYRSAGRSLHAQRTPHVDAARALRNYGVSIVSTSETVAGRATVRLRFEPRRPGASTVEIWVDVASGLALRVDRLDASGAVASSIHYDDIRVGGIEREEGDPPTLPDPPATAAASALSFQPLVPGRGLEGFERVETNVVQIPFDDRIVFLQRERWTDGVESFLVFQADPKDAVFGEPAPPTPTGATTITTYSVGGVSMLTCTRDGRTLAAIGRLPERELGELLARYSPR